MGNLSKLEFNSYLKDGDVLTSGQGGFTVVKRALPFALSVALFLLLLVNINPACAQLVDLGSVGGGHGTTIVQPTGGGSGGTVVAPSSAPSTNTDFDAINNVLVAWTTGTLGKSLTLIAFILGMFVGAAKQDYFAMLGGIVIAVIIQVTPQFIYSTVDGSVINTAATSSGAVIAMSGDVCLTNPPPGGFANVAIC